MKTIVKLILFTGVLALAVTGCQKDSDNPDAVLKAGIGDPLTECSDNGDLCGGSAIKAEWDQVTDFGDGTYYSQYDDANVITITASDNSCFTWSSLAPVCKILIKAGRDYEILYPNSTGGTICTTLDKAISHVTFCYNSNPMVIAFKTQLSPGGLAYTFVASQTGTFVDYYPFVNGINGKIYYDDDMTPVGNITVGDIDADGLLEVTIDNSDNSEVFFYAAHWLFIGTLEEFNACENYGDFTYQWNTYTPSTSLIWNLTF